MAVSQAFIEELISRCPIEDIVQSYVPLVKKGANFFGRCPFHNEKTPSFSVSAQKQIFHCFGCGEGGNVIGFIMKVENLDFMEAVKLLAKKANMTVPEDGYENMDAAKLRQKIYEMNKLAARFFYDSLKGEAAGKAKEYIKKRGIKSQTAVRFGLGYAPDAWDSLVNFLEKEGYSKYEIVQAGLAVNQKGKIYDKFRNRIIFPIIDLRGNVIAFGGRVLDDSMPKYLNSPDTPVFSKSRNLYALNIVKNKVAGRIILAEGYMDVISLHEAGFEFAVASLGTSLTAQQAKLISRYAAEVVICYDSDGAGQTAAIRAIDILKEANLAVKVLNIKGAKDPDEYIKKFGADSFSVMLNGSENHILYKLNSAKQKYDLNRSDEKVKFLQEASEIFSAVDSPVEREVYINRLAEETGISQKTIESEVFRRKNNKTKAAAEKKIKQETTPRNFIIKRSKAANAQNPKTLLSEEGLCHIAINYPDKLPKILEKISPEEFLNEATREMFQAAAQAGAEGRRIGAGDFGRSFKPEYESYAAYLMTFELSIEEIDRAAEDFIHKIKEQAVISGENSDSNLKILYEELKKHKSGRI